VVAWPQEARASLGAAMAVVARVGTPRGARQALCQEGSGLEESANAWAHIALGEGRCSAAGSPAPRRLPTGRHAVHIGVHARPRAPAAVTVFRHLANIFVTVGPLGLSHRPLTTDRMPLMAACSTGFRDGAEPGSACGTGFAG
jgi:hypothetical protein